MFLFSPLKNRPSANVIQENNTSNAALALTYKYHSYLGIQRGLKDENDRQLGLVC